MSTRLPGGPGRRSDLFFVVVVLVIAAICCWWESGWWCIELSRCASKKGLFWGGWSGSSEAAGRHHHVLEHLYEYNRLAHWHGIERVDQSTLYCITTTFPILCIVTPYIAGEPSPRVPALTKQGSPPGVTWKFLAATRRQFFAAVLSPNTFFVVRKRPKVSDTASPLSIAASSHIVFVTRDFYHMLLEFGRNNNTTSYMVFSPMMNGK